MLGAGLFLVTQQFSYRSSPMPKARAISAVTTIQVWNLNVFISLPAGQAFFFALLLSSSDSVPDRRPCGSFVNREGKLPRVPLRGFQEAWVLPGQPLSNMEAACHGNHRQTGDPFFLCGSSSLPQCVISSPHF